MHCPLFLVLLSYLSFAEETCPSVPGNERLGCWSWWKYDFTESKCLERGCCWAPSVTTTQWCYFPHPKADIKTVHVVQGCHLDVGFAGKEFCVSVPNFSDTAPNIINRWFHEFFPLAYHVGKELEAMGNQTEARLKFTAQSWLVSLYLDCPKNYVVCQKQKSGFSFFRESFAQMPLSFNGSLSLFRRSG